MNRPNQKFQIAPIRSRTRRSRLGPFDESRKPEGKLCELACRRGSHFYDGGQIVEKRLLRVDGVTSAIKQYTVQKIEDVLILKVPFYQPVALFARQPLKSNVRLPGFNINAELRSTQHRVVVDSADDPALQLNLWLS